MAGENGAISMAAGRAHKVVLISARHMAGASDVHSREVVRSLLGGRVVSVLLMGAKWHCSKIKMAQRMPE